MRILVWQANHLETPEIIERYVQRVREECVGRAECFVTKSEEEAARLIADADAACVWRITPKVFAAARNLRWISFGSAGIEHSLFPELLASQVMLTTLSGVHSTPMAEHCFSYILAFARRLHIGIRQQARSEWRRDSIAGDTIELPGETLGIVGYGKIGREIGRLGRAFGMRVLGVKRAPLSDAERADKGAEEEITDLSQVLRESRFLVLACPLTRETEHLINRERLEAMRRDAYLVNIARGRVIDEAALIEALSQGTIAGAALDVFEEEPLPRTSPLWRMDNVIITPHTAGSTAAYWERAGDLFAENLRRFQYGEPLLNVYDRAREY